jgi:Uma2 family endonuclease
LIKIPNDYYSSLLERKMLAQLAKTVEEEWPVAEFPDTADLPTEDGIPLESPWHRAEINLLIDILVHAWRDRTDYYVGGNMFIYFSREQVLNRDYRGPEFFVVKYVDGTAERGSWIVWEEGGRYPDLIIELLSPSTAEMDKTVKKQLYEQTFRTPEYFCYDPYNQELLGWRLGNGSYYSLEPDENGQLWSSMLQAWIGLWEGEFLGRTKIWLRLFDENGQLLLTGMEAERQRAEQEKAARLTAESEAAELREELERLRRSS